MSKTLSINSRYLCALLLVVVLRSGLVHAEDSPQEMIARSDAFRQPIKEGVMVFAISSHREGELVAEAIHEVRIKGRDRSLVFAVAGRDKGQRVLMNRENLWVQLPTMSRALRVTQMQRLMGEVSFGDIGRISWAEDYTAAFHPEIRQEMINGIDAWRLRLVSRNELATYPQIEVWLAKTDGRPLQANYYLNSGKLLKTASFGSLEVLDGRKVVREIVYRDMLKLKSYSVLRMERYKSEQLSDAMFNVQRFSE